MSAWRRKALELFPDLREEINPVPRIHRGYDSYWFLFMDLRSKLEEALKRSDRESLGRIFAIAHWAFRQGRNPDLTTAVCVCFYEHVFDVAPRHWDEVISRLRTEILRRCWSLWEARLEKSDLEQLRARVQFHLDRLDRRPSQR